MNTDRIGGCADFGWDKVSMGWFGFVQETVLVRQGCFVTAEQGLHSIKALSAPHPSSEEAGGAQGAGRGHSWAADPSTKSVSEKLETPLSAHFQLLFVSTLACSENGLHLKSL